MIVSLRKMDYQELKKQLNKDDKIVLWSCNCCAVMCGIGGYDKMMCLEKMLKADGYQVIGKELLSVACMNSLAKKRKEKKSDLFSEATKVICLTCEDGYEVANTVLEDQDVFCIARTLGIGNFTMDRGPILTTPLAWTGLEKDSNGYSFPQLAEKLDLYPQFFTAEHRKSINENIINITINGEEYQAEEGSTIMEVCQNYDISIPHLCYQPGLSPDANCRLCLVKIKGEDKLLPACATKIKEDMKIITEDDELNHMRKIILELLISSNEHNCLTCFKGNPGVNGACELQELIRSFNIKESRYDKNSEEKAIDNTSPILSYDPNKCVLCGRCVRTCREVAGQCNLGFVNRGDETFVAAGANRNFDQSQCVDCLACVQVCPTGALTEKIAHYEGEKWEEEELLFQS